MAAAKAFAEAEDISVQPQNTTTLPARPAFISGWYRGNGARVVGDRSANMIKMFPARNMISISRRKFSNHLFRVHHVQNLLLRLLVDLLIATF
jgi:hypothetical protein